MKLLAHKSRNKAHVGIEALEQKFAELCVAVAGNEKKIRTKIGSMVLNSSNHGVDQKLSVSNICRTADNSYDVNCDV